jgi:hypothetical protein
MFCDPGLAPTIVFGAASKFCFAQYGTGGGFASQNACKIVANSGLEGSQSVRQLTGHLEGSLGSRGLNSGVIGP